MSGNVSKHVTLVGELSRKVGVGKLLEVGELEQSLAVSDNHSSDVRMLEQIVTDPSLTCEYKTKLVLLYALRYEKSQGNKIQQFVESLKQNGASDKLVSLVDAILKYAGSEQRLEPASPVEDFIGRTKNVFKGLKVRLID